MGWQQNLCRACGLIFPSCLTKLQRIPINFFSRASGDRTGLFAKVVASAMNGGFLWSGDMAFPTWQNPCDWVTQCWNIALGKRMRPGLDDWLLGPVGEIGESADDFVARHAREHGWTVRRGDPDAGLIEPAADWGLPLNDDVADFYARTGAYAFEVRGSWKPVFGSLGYLVAEHSLSLWALPVYRMRYRILKRP